MKPLRLKLRKVGPFKDLDLDFSSIAGDTVAITGDNGEGKTFIMESIFASMYRYFPSRKKSIYNYCQGKDAQIDFTFQMQDGIYQSIINMDCNLDVMEPTLIKDGIAITNGKTRSFDEEIRKALGTPDLALMSVFSSQKKDGSFLNLKKADRKTLFIWMLGLENLERIAKLASKKESEFVSECAKLIGELDALRGMVPKDSPELRAKEARDKTFQLSEIYLLENEALDHAREELLKIKLELTGRAELMLSKKSLENRLFSIDREIAKIQKTLGEYENLKDSLPKLRSQLNELEEFSKESEAMSAELVKCRHDLETLVTSKADYDALHSELEIERMSIDRQIRTSKAQLQRDELDSSTISCVPCKAGEQFKDCQFLVRAIEAKDSLVTLEGKIDGDTARLLLQEQKLKDLGKFDTTIIVATQNRIKDLEQKISMWSLRQSSKPTVISNISRAEVAEDSINIIQEQINDKISIRNSYIEDIHDIQERIDKYQEWEEKEVGVTKAIESLTAGLVKYKAEISSLNMLVAQEEAALNNARKAQERIINVNDSLRSLEFQKGSWAMLAKAFGKMGIQSLELGACGPLISSIANDILFSCYGPRFSMKFITERPTADGDAMTDEFDIYVYDQKEGREGSIDDLSVGEGVICSEAAGLGISLFNRQRTDSGWQTLFRDETTGSLNKDNAFRYIDMLRKAKSLGHFSQVFFVAHQDFLWDNADCRIHVSNGNVEIFG